VPKQGTSKGNKGWGLKSHLRNGTGREKAKIKKKLQQGKESQNWGKASEKGHTARLHYPPVKLRRKKRNAVWQGKKGDIENRGKMSLSSGRSVILGGAQWGGQAPARLAKNRKARGRFRGGSRFVVA